jgi:hypothetical protein
MLRRALAAALCTLWILLATGMVPMRPPSHPSRLSQALTTLS